MHPLAYRSNGVLPDLSQCMWEEQPSSLDHSLPDTFTKDMVKNKFPFSREFGNGTVVPRGQGIIKNDRHVLFAIGGVCAPRFLHRVQHPYRHA